MKPREINENPDTTIMVPDSIADWDAPSDWERERLASMELHLKPGMVLFDVGTEHGWLSVVYGRNVGHENMVLFEPSPELWVNIRKTWEANELRTPLGMFAGFVSDVTAPGLKIPKTKAAKWPAAADAGLPETPAMAYRSLNGDDDIPTVTIDEFVQQTGIVPDAITIDVEGAEMRVLKGAFATLREYRPLVWCSVHPDPLARDFDVPDVQELFDLMTACGYGREYLGTDHEQHQFFGPLEYIGPDADPRPS